jgi:hypothetical protein
VLPLGLRFKKFLKALGLRALILGKPMFPKSLITNAFFRATHIRLEFEGEKRNGEVIVCKYKYGAKSALCMSIDFDLPVSQPLRTDWRTATTEILQLTEKYSVPMSWGMCGVLALNESQTFNQIRNSTIPQDLGVHTFTHADLSSPSCTNNLARDEILKCADLLKDVKRPVTFIFPWNKLGHLSLLRKYGFVTYRGNKTPKLTYPSKLQQLWDVPGTYYLVERSAEEVSVIIGLLDFAISYGCVLHFWSHPWDMSINGNVRRFMGTILDPLFSHAVMKRKRGLLWICTMRELANYCEARENCCIENINETKGKISFSVHCEIEDQRFDFPPSTTLQIPVPRRWKGVRVLLDGVEQRFDASCLLTKRWWNSYLFLTLSFKEPTHEVSVVEVDQENGAGATH